jgi:hypothetical protein
MIPSMDADRYLRIARLAALKDAAALTDALDALTDSPDQIATTLRAHHIASLVHASLDSPSERAWFGALLDAIDRLRRFPFPTATECMTGFDEVRERLGARDVDVLLLKGVYFAERLYGGSRWRPQFDVDILIPAAAHRRAHRTLIDAGFQRTAYDLHSATFSRDRLKVDVHAWLRRAPAYHLDERLIWFRNVYPGTLSRLSALVLGRRLPGSRHGAVTEPRDCGWTRGRWSRADAERGCHGTHGARGVTDHTETHG